ncbi:MAG: prepilin-type N-terminal cleavage/methylation domain-containing protein [Actinomycetota bacterium]|nr:prepilin-type N-terminal cleavage/methylation domain-containing protein [Actinomycetota bacterium]
MKPGSLAAKDIRGDPGFTLIEMLVVLVILPLVVGAVADVILTAVRNDSVVSGRLSDTQAGQVLSSYFGPDVQSAVAVTTAPSLACGRVGQAVGGYSLLANPDPGSSYPLSVAIGAGSTPTVVTYWLADPTSGPATQGSVVRVTCPDTPISAPSGASEPVAAWLGTASTPLFLTASIAGPDASARWVPAGSIRTVTLDAGHGGNDVSQSLGLEIDLVAAPRSSVSTTSVGP